MKKGRGITYYPLFLNVKGKRCVVIGGGQVALRKVRILLEHDADVVVISPDLCPELAELAGSGAISALTRKYRTVCGPGVVMSVDTVSDESAASIHKVASLDPNDSGPTEVSVSYSTIVPGSPAGSGRRSGSDPGPPPGNPPQKRRRLLPGGPSSGCCCSAPDRAP